MNKKSIWYFILGGVVILADRITKYWALTSITEYKEVNRFLAFDVMFNRGFSWGMFHSPDDRMFMVVNAVIVLLIIGVAWYASMRWLRSYHVVGEVLVLAGALSNVIDRIVYHGVIDFIILSYMNWTWPVFNIADVSIVVGALIMLCTNFND